MNLLLSGLSQCKYFKEQEFLQAIMLIFQNTYDNIILIQLKILETPQPNLYIGGDDRGRTDDLPLAKRALYQLSYIPSH